MKGDILLNLDSEEEGVLYVGCAGDTTANVRFLYTETPVPASQKAFKLAITGLKGGHSGLEIILGRGNSNKLINRFLKHSAIKYNLHLSSIEGGSLSNAIPRESFAIITIPSPEEDHFVKCLDKYYQTFLQELSGVETDLKFTCEPVALPASIIDEDTQKRLFNAIYACPNGVIRMSDAMPGLVETSNNLAIVKSGNGEIKIQCLLRSSVDSAKDELGEMVCAVFELAGAEIELNGIFSGWKPNMNSPILMTMMNVYQKLYGKIPEIKATHGGLECGLLGGVYPNWDMISFGPTIRYPHSPDEKVFIASVDKFWKFLIETLKVVPVKV